MGAACLPAPRATSTSRPSPLQPRSVSPPTGTSALCPALLRGLSVTQFSREPQGKLARSRRQSGTEPRSLRSKPRPAPRTRSLGRPAPAVPRGARCPPGPAQVRVLSPPAVRFPPRAGKGRGFQTSSLGPLCPSLRLGHCPWYLQWRAAKPGVTMTERNEGPPGPQQRRPWQTRRAAGSR